MPWRLTEEAGASIESWIDSESPDEFVRREVLIWLLSVGDDWPDVHGYKVLEVGDIFSIMMLTAPVVIHLLALPQTYELILMRIAGS